MLGNTFLDYIFIDYIYLIGSVWGKNDATQELFKVYYLYLII